MIFGVISSVAGSTSANTGRRRQVDNLRRGNEGVGRDDDFVARPNIERQQSGGCAAWSSC